jgi:ubiquinone biosynthesis protein UbiJ
MLASVAIAPLNHLLREESWALKRLQAHAGKTARFRLPPFPDLTLTIQASGEVSAAAKGASDDATLTLVPGLLPRLLAHDEAAYRKVRVLGDSEFGEEILLIGKNLHWDVEQDISGVMGDILAHRVMRAGEGLMHWQTETARNLWQALVEYLTEEQPLLAKSMDMHELIREMNTLRSRAASLEVRVNALDR